MLYSLVFDNGDMLPEHNFIATVYSKMFYKIFCILFAKYYLYHQKLNQMGTVVNEFMSLLNFKKEIFNFVT